MNSTYHTPISSGRVGDIKWRHQYTSSQVRSALVYFPITLFDHSGIAHVLEHVTALTPVGQGRSWAELEYACHDLKINARTESDHIAFHFTCVSASTFSLALDTLLRAALLEVPDELLFQQECFTFECNPHDLTGPRIGGTVFNEMKGRFRSVDRQLDSGTLHILYPDRAWHFDPGGDPDLIRRLRFEDVSAFRDRSLRAACCTVLCSTPDDPLDLRELLRPFEVVPGRVNSGAEMVRRVGYFYAPSYQTEETDPDRHYNRIVLDIGSPTRAKDLVASWLLELAVTTFSPAFEAFAHKLALRFEPALSGAMDLGMREVLALTFSGTSGDRSILPKMSPVLSQLLQGMSVLDAEPWLTQCYLDMREQIHHMDNSEATHLYLQARSILNGDEAGFSTMSHQVDNAMRSCLAVGGLAALGGQLAHTCVSKEVVVRPHHLTAQAHESRERRIVRRLSHFGFRRSAPQCERASVLDNFHPAPVPELVQKALAPLETGGVVYVHRVCNISLLDDDQLLLLPLLLGKTEADLAAAGHRVKSFLFAHAVAPGESILLVAFKTRLLADRGQGEQVLQDALNKVLSAFSERVSVDDGFIESIRHTIGATPASVALSQCSQQRGLASRAIRSWRGADQLMFLKLAKQQDNRVNICESLRRLAQQLLASPAVSVVLGKGHSPVEVLDAVGRESRAQNWPHQVAGRYSAGQQSTTSRSLLRGDYNDSVIAKRIALSLDDCSQAASMLALGSSIEEHCLRPQLRNQLGAYGALLGVDVATAELYLLVQQISAVNEALNVLDRMRPVEALMGLTTGDFDRLRQRTLWRLHGQESSINATIRDSYNLLTRADIRLSALTDSLARLNLPTALEWVDQTFSAAGGGGELTVYLPAHETNAMEQVTWKVLDLTG